MKYHVKNILFLVAVRTFFLSFLSLGAQNKTINTPPNIIVIFADDLGYGDLGCYGHPTINTPSLDKMAAEGLRFTQFYVGASVCTPSRAALLTGRLPIRSGMAGSDSSGNVLYPRSTGGLPASEITIAEALREKDYQSAIIGKWHLGHKEGFLPLNHGFDYWFGIPYSNDMIPPRYKTAPLLPLYENEKVIESDPDQRLLTKRYTEKAIHFITENKDRPFFLYYPNNFPHTPLYASDDFQNKSRRGLYGDVVEELDWSVGEILKTLKSLGIAENTLVIFTSDNGPWLLRDVEGGSAGLLYEGKSSSYEGGYRVPAIAWWPGTIKAGETTASVAATMDIYATALKLADVELPKDRKIDGSDLYPLLTDSKKEVRDIVYYYTRHQLYAVRKGAWKAHFTTRPSYKKEVPPKEHVPPLLFNIENDPSEQYEVGQYHPEIIEELKKLFEAHLNDIEPVISQLDLGY